MKKLFKRLFFALKSILVALLEGFGFMGAGVLFILFFIGGGFVNSVISYFDRCLKSR